MKRLLILLLCAASVSTYAQTATDFKADDTWGNSDYDLYSTLEQGKYFVLYWWKPN